MWWWSQAATPGAIPLARCKIHMLMLTHHKFQFLSNRSWQNVSLCPSGYVLGISGEVDLSLQAPPAQCAMSACLGEKSQKLTMKTGTVTFLLQFHYHTALHRAGKHKGLCCAAHNLSTMLQPDDCETLKKLFRV